MTDNEDIWDMWWRSLMTAVAEYDVTTIKEGEIRNINDIPIDRQGDIGIDKERKMYRFTNDEWRKL